MNEIMKAVYTSHFPRLKVKISKFTHKDTGELRFAVMQVNNTHKVYDGRYWTREKEEYEVENTEMIQEIFHQMLLDKIEEEK